MKPVNRRKQKQRYLQLGAVLYVLILYFGLHLGAVKISSWLQLKLVIDHMIHHPLSVFPINYNTLRQCAVLGLLAPLSLYTEYLKRRDLRAGVEDGSARWNEDLRAYNRKYTEMRTMVPAFLQNLCDRLSEIPVVGGLFLRLKKWQIKKFSFLDRRGGGKTRNMILSKDIFLNMDTRKTRLNNNVLVIGGAGTGKSRFVVKPNILQSNCSYVITDPAGELLTTMGGYLEKQGYVVRVFNLVQKDHSSTYNPFHYIRDEAGVLTMITALINNTTPKGSRSSDPFWEKAETALLEALCFYLQSECSEEDQNFSNVMVLLRCIKAEEGREDEKCVMDIMMDDLSLKNPEHIAVQSYAVFKSAGGGKTAQSIMISCQTRLQTFNLTDIKNLTSTDNLDLTSIGDRKTALFCVTPVADSTFNYLVALMYTQLFECLYYHAETECPDLRLPVPVRFLLDEFANIGTIPEFAQKLSTMRKYEISCTIIIQALSQLKAMYKDEWEVLIGNCDSFLFLGGQDSTTLDYVSKKLGKETIRSINNSRSYGRSGGSSMSYNKTGRELMTSTELGGMDNNNCVLFIRGLYPFFTQKFHLERHRCYKESGDAKESLKFDVKKIHTGEAVHAAAQTKEILRVMDEAKCTDPQEAKYLYRNNTRPIQKQSAGGIPLYQKPRPLMENLPYSNVPEAERTPEMNKARTQAVKRMKIISTSHVTEKTMKEDAAYILQQREQENVMFEQFGDMPIADESASFDTYKPDTGPTLGNLTSPVNIGGAPIKSAGEGQ